MNRLCCIILSGLFSLCLQAEPVEGCPAEVSMAAPFDAFEQADPSLPYSQALLWQVAKDGQVKGHVFGTIHLDYPRVTRLPPQVQLIFARSSSVLLETILDDAAHRIYRQAIYSPPSDAIDLNTSLSPALQRKLQTLLQSYGLSIAQQKGLKPWAIFSMLGRPRPRSGLVLDEVLRQMAEQSRKAVYGMETMPQLINALESIPSADQISILIDTLCQYESLMSSVNVLLETYAARNLAAMVALSEQPHTDEAVFQRFMQVLLYERNDRMLESMLTHLQRGSVFIAMGALHLPGEKGLLNRLAKAGYTISPVF